MLALCTNYISECTLDLFDYRNGNGCDRQKTGIRARYKCSVNTFVAIPEIVCV